MSDPKDEPLLLEMVAPLDQGPKMAIGISRAGADAFTEWAASLGMTVDEAMDYIGGLLVPKGDW